MLAAMIDLIEAIPKRPLVLMLSSFGVLCFATWVGVALLAKLKVQVAELSEDLHIVENATLTLLALIIGFAFSMAVSRYDQRKNLEEAEANAIGTEWVRVELLPAEDAARLKALLLAYTEARIAFYRTSDDSEVAEIDRRTLKLQDELWAAIKGPALRAPTPVTALAVSGMNDVLNSQSYTQAAWLNRIPTGAWTLCLFIGIGATMLVGLGAKNTKSLSRVLLILPFVISVSFFLICDIDTPRHGLIAVHPTNLELLFQSMRTPAR